jgi:hypothetical protein
VTVRATAGPPPPPPTRAEVQTARDYLVKVGVIATRRMEHEVAVLMALAEWWLAHPQRPAPPDELASWNAADPDATEWTDAHAYHAGLVAGWRQAECYHGLGDIFDLMRLDSHASQEPAP